MLLRSTKSLLTFTKVKRYKILSRGQAHIVSICFQSQLESRFIGSDPRIRRLCKQTAVHTYAEVDTSLLTIVYIMLSIATKQSSTHTDVQVYNHKVLSILWIPLPLLHNLQHTLTDVQV